MEKSYNKSFVFFKSVTMGANSSTTITKKLQIKKDKIDLKKYPPAENVPPFPWMKQFIECKVYEVHDGDTVKVLINYHDILFNVAIRIQGIDAPEISRCCELEKEAGMYVKKYIQDKIEGKIVRLYCTEWDKYGGRIVGILYLENEEMDNLSDHLLAQKLVKPYTGKVAKEPWTDEELHALLDL